MKRPSAIVRTCVLPFVGEVEVAVVVAVVVEDVIVGCLVGGRVAGVGAVGGGSYLHSNDPGVGETIWQFGGGHTPLKKH